MVLNSVYMFIENLGKTPKRKIITEKSSREAEKKEKDNFLLCMSRVTANPGISSDESLPVHENEMQISNLI